MWFTGIDWADNHHDIVVLNEDGQLCFRLRIAHTADGVSELITRLRAITGPHHQEEMICVLETNANLLVTALLDAGFALYPVNPKTTDRWRPASGAKSDTHDAWILAKVARSDWQELRRLSLPPEGLQELKALVEDQQKLIKEQTRLSNQLKACLKTYYPLVVTSFSEDMTQKSLLAFLLAYPTPEAAQQASLEELITLFKAAKNPRARQRAQILWQQAQQPALVATASTVRSKARWMQALVLQLQLVDQQIHDYAQVITELYQQQEEYEVFDSLPATGQRLGPQLIALLGCFSVADMDCQEIQQRGGTVPVTIQSGNSRQVMQRMACDKSLRDTLYQYGMQTIKHVDWAKVYYRKKRAQGKTHAAALRAVTAIWLRIIWAMRREKACYQESTFLAARGRHSPQAA